MWRGALSAVMLVALLACAAPASGPPSGSATRVEPAASAPAQAADSVAPAAQPTPATAAPPVTALSPPVTVKLGLLMTLSDA
ncbi:MAG TPA: hypothetical protein VFE37_13560, partial [Chloroflexota bacterium]|nr:hypothetical protein [Chloroflexota bacterium]